MRSFTAATLLAVVPAFVQAHGIVSSIAVSGGETFKSPTIGGSGKTGPFYVVSDNSPVADTSSKDMTCGRVATKASETPEIKAGATLSYKWGSGYSNEGGNWPHEEGPMFFYMAECSSDDCSAEAGGSGKFFKLQQDGFVGGGKWKQADLHSGKSIDFTVPSGLKAGTYLIRHEVINLANTAEMFPSCARFKVTGGGSTALSGDSAKFPGAYSASDKGLTVAGAAVYEIKADSGYDFPGPKLISLGSGSSGGSSDSGSEDDSGSSDSSDAAPSSTAAGKPAATGVNNGSNGGSGSEDAASSASDAVPTESSSASEPAATEPASPSGSADSGEESGSSESDESGASEPAAAAPSGGTDSSAVAACNEAYATCNAKYMSDLAAAQPTVGAGVESASNNTKRDTAYNCQQEYTTCVAGAAKKARRMHRLRRGVQFVHSSH